MPNKIKIPKKCLNKGFSRKEIKMIILSLLKPINLSCRNNGKVEVRIKHLGVLHTHRNTLSGKQRYQKQFAKADWKKKKEVIEFSEKYLLF